MENIMAIAFDKMLFPVLTSTEPSQALTTFRQQTLDLFLDLLRKYEVQGFEAIKSKQLTSDALLSHAESVANQQGLNDEASFKAFANARIPEGKTAKAKVLKLQDKMSMMDKIVYGPKLLKFQSDAKSFYSRNKDLVNKSGYKNVGDLQFALLGTLAYLAKTHGTAVSSSSGNTSSGTSAQPMNTQGSDTQGSNTQGGASGSPGTSGKKTPTWVLPAIVLGGVGIVASVFILRKQSKKTKKRERR